MPQLPFEIPKSLASYAEHFDKEPIEATKRLKKQLKKRGPDAVGHFLLAWFYHLEDKNEKAIDEALKARVFAPGSPFFENLHYYLSHPNTFQAWTPDAYTSSKNNRTPTHEPGPVLNLDALIERLSSMESKKIRPKEENLSVSKEASDLPNDDVNDIVSETLASIHEKQGKYSAAINTYEQLKKIREDKTDYYNEEIARLKAVKENSKEEE